MLLPKVTYADFKTVSEIGGIRAAAALKSKNCCEVSPHPTFWHRVIDADNRSLPLECL